MKQQRPNRTRNARPVASGKKFSGKRAAAPAHDDRPRSAFISRRNARGAAEAKESSGYKSFAPYKSKRTGRDESSRPAHAGKKFVARDDKPKKSFSTRRNTQNIEETREDRKHKDFASRKPARKDRDESKTSAHDHRGRQEQKDDYRRKDRPFTKPKPAIKIFERRTTQAPKIITVKATAKQPREGVLLWGIHAVREAWMNPNRKCFHLWLTDAGKEAMDETLLSASQTDMERPAPTIAADRGELDRLLPPNSVHQGVALEVAPLPNLQLHEILQVENMPDLIIVLDQVTDPHNVGAILRSAAAFGAGAVIMTERNAPSTTGVMAKTASGAAEHVPQIHVVNLSRTLIELQEYGYWCVGLAEQGERNLSELDLSGRTALVLGAEGGGLRRLTREHCDELAKLPTGGVIGTLNVSNAAAVSLYEVRRQKMKFDVPPV